MAGIKGDVTTGFWVAVGALAALLVVGFVIGRVTH